MGNKGAYIRFNDEYAPEYHTFSAVPHPDVKPMAYAKNMMNFM
jgi:serine/threonine-protein phosphatase 5